MVRATDRQPSMLGSLDWWTIGIYLALLTFGWISVCGASYTYGDTDIFSLDTRSGMQIVWIGTSICLGFVLLTLDDHFYDTFAFFIYVGMLLLLFATIFNPHEIKGSRSWLVLCPPRPTWRCPPRRWQRWRFARASWGWRGRATGGVHV